MTQQPEPRSSSMSKPSQSGLARPNPQPDGNKMAQPNYTPGTPTVPYRPPAVQNQQPQVDVDVEAFNPAQLVQGGTELVDAAFDAAEHGMEMRFQERGQRLVRRTNMMMAALFNGMAAKSGQIRSAYITPVLETSDESHEGN
jgi:hypothetical protein